MTLDEAQKIARIVATADYGCSVCVSRLAHQLNETFPSFKWTPTDEEQYPEGADPEIDPSEGFVVAVEAVTPDT